MKTILLDVDDVLVDCAETVYRQAKKWFAKKLPPPKDWKTFAFHEAMGLTKSEGEFLYARLKKRDNIGYQINWFPQAQSFVEHLGFQNKVVFCTAPWWGLEHWCEARYRLLEPYLGRRNFSLVLTDDKSQVKGDWLIDDKYENISGDLDRGILFEKPWNAKARKSVLYSAANYADVLKIVEK